MTPKTTAGALTSAGSFVITLKGRFNPALHHPSWYYTMGQLSKEDAALAVQAADLYVTPTAGSFTARSFRIDCTPTRWRIETWDQAARLRILQVTLKTFDDLLPESGSSLTQVGFEFTFTVAFAHHRTTDFLAKLVSTLSSFDSRGETALTVVATVAGDPPRKKRVQIHSAPGQDQAQLSFRFGYPVVAERLSTLKQLSLAEDYELDYEEAVTHAERIAHELATVTAEGRIDPHDN